MTAPIGVNRIHPFERAGFGHAPYRCVGHFEAVYQACPGAPIQPGSSCEYCGQAIRDVFKVRSVDGVEFRVGCDCILKVFRGYDKTIPADFRAAVLEVERAKRENRRVRREGLLTARRDRAVVALATRPELFRDAPHPNEYHASKGLTLRDYYDWCLAHRANLVHICQAVEHATETQ